MALQLLRTLGQNGRLAFREPRAGERLPYRAQVDDHTLLLRDGRLMQVLHVNGLAFETADTEELNYRKSLRDTMLRAVGSSRFAVYHHILRRRVTANLGGTFPDPFSQTLDERWQKRLAAKALFRNDLFISIVQRPEGGESFMAKLLRRLASGTLSDDEQTHLAADISGLDAVREAMLSALSAYGARTLGVYESKGALHSEALEFLSALYNGEVRPIQLPHGDVGHYIPYRRVFIGADALEHSSSGDEAERFSGIVSLKDYPSTSYPGMLDELLRLPLELTVSQSFSFENRQAALGRVNLALRRMRAADDEAVSLRDELADARDDVAAGRATYGEHHLTIAVHGSNPKDVDQGVAEVRASLADLGIVSIREDLGLEPAFWAQFPGNQDFIARKAMISSRNFASFASGHNFSAGTATGGFWGDAITVLETTAASPYFFNFHHGDLGNFTIIGPSGSGKTVVLNFLLAQALRHRPRLVFFDKDRSGELFVRAIGGRYDVLRPGEASGLNPLMLSDTPTNRKFIIDWIGNLVSGKGHETDAADIARIETAVAANFQAPASLRRLRSFADLLRGSERPHGDDLYARLRPWFGDGENAWLFDNEDDLLDADQGILGFDMTHVLDDPKARTPAMMYLFHRIEECLDGSKTIIVIDEGWKALDDSIFVTRLKDWQKTIRKRNGLVGFVTQSADDALSSTIASAVIEQSATQIFMANPKAQPEAYMGGFGLSAHEFELVRTLPDDAHCFLIKHGLECVVARLNLRGDADLLTVLSGREKTVRLLDELRAQVGDDPAAWLPPLLAAAQ